MYNITMTSLPIMWFAIFDFEFEKDREEAQKAGYVSIGDGKLFMRNPQLYKLGMNGSCFSLKILSQWILYAIWHAFVIYNVNFYVLSQDDTYSSIG